MNNNRVISLILLLVFLLQGAYCIFSQSPTFDEQIHLASGYYYWKTGDFSLDGLDHPPLPKLLCSLPALLLRPELPGPGTGWQGGTQYEYAFNYLFRNTVSPSAICNSGRFVMLLLGALLGWALCRKAEEFYGGGAGLAALFLFSFCPSVLANSTLVTTDLLPSMFMFLSAASVISVLRGRGNAAVPGILTGLALVSKFSAVLVLPVLAAICLAELAAAGWKADVRKSAAGCAVFAAAALLTVLAVYRVVNIKYYFLGLQTVFAKITSPTGFDFFLAGKYSAAGWKHYFLAGFLLKTPLPLIALSAAGLAALAGLKARDGRDKALVSAYMYGAAVLIVAAASFSRFQIGHRHILPAYPFLLMAAAPALRDVFTRGRAVKYAARALCAWYAAGTLLVAPYCLAYFNEAAGGPGNGYRWLVDSNLDSGQGLKALGAYAEKHDAGELYLSYFGTADPRYYGISYRPLGMVTNASAIAAHSVDKAARGLPGLLAVSATNLQGAYYANHGAFGWLKDRKPAGVAGRSIFIYDISRDAESRRRVGDLLFSAGDSAGRDAEYARAEELSGGK